MTLTRISQLSLRPLAAEASDLAPRSEILIDGEGTGRVVAGAFFEAAIRWEDRFLLFATDDVPNEETLRIYLLDNELNVMDWARLSAMYATGHLSALELKQPDLVRFRFFGDTVWTITLLPSPAFHLPVLADPRGVRRPLRLRRAFELDGKPQPEPRD